MHLFTIPNWIYFGCGVTTASLALWKGEWPGRVVGAAVLIKFVTESHIVFDWTSPGWYDIGLDLVIFASCVLGALRSDRYWTIWASSFALLGVVTHPMQFVPGVGVWAYLSALRVWSILLLVAMLTGVLSRSREPRHAAPGAA